MSILHPHDIFRRIHEIPTEYFTKRGIDTLLLDVDNTLTHDNHPEPDAEVALWIERQCSAGFRLMILSNNFTSRVKPFAEKLGLEYIAGAAKPLPINLRKALSGMGVELCHAAIIGDQIFTDILCGRLAGCHTVMVEPFAPERHVLFRLKRALERRVLRSYPPKGE